MKRIVIIGARQHAKVVHNLLTTSERSKRDVTVVGFIDDNPALIGTELLGLPIIAAFKDLPQIRRNMELGGAIMGISNLHMKIRSEYFKSFRGQGLESLNAIHDSAIIEESARIGTGIVLNPLCVVNAYARVGDNVVAYSGVTIEHEDFISENVYFGPGVNLASGVHVGEGTFIGAGVKVIPDISIGRGVTIGAGSVIIEDVPDNCVVVGAPGRIIRVSG